MVPQTGKNADAIRENLKRVKLPPGFKIELYAIVPDARHMAVAPSTNMLFVGTRKTTVWAVTDRNSDGVADEVKAFAPSLNFTFPNGVCWTKDGFLIVVEHNRVLNFPAAEFFYEGPDVAVIEVVPQGQLIPPEEESYNHGARTCRIGDDGKLYITLGQPYNVQPRDKLASTRSWASAASCGMNAFDGSKREVYAHGRPQFGRHRLQPEGQDALVHRQPDRRHGRRHPAGRNQPRHEGAASSSATRRSAGQDAHHRVRLRQGLRCRRTSTNPQVMTDAHAADLGIAFYTGKKFPAKYQGGFFSAAARLVEPHHAHRRAGDVHSLKADGTADKTEVFADGWLDGETASIAAGRWTWRTMKDGSLLVSDDFAGAIYRITYVGARKRRASAGGGDPALAAARRRCSPPRRLARAAADATPPAGQGAACAVCHGAYGIGRGAGRAQPRRPAAHLVDAAAQGYRSGERSTR